MREILFKAKRIDNSEWVEGYYSPHPHPFSGFLKDFIFAPYYDKEKECGYDNGYQIDVNTICQYTGLTDKNGNKIFENDVLMFHSNKNDLAKACYGEFYVIDVETLEKIDSVIGWHYEVIETDAISKCEPFNIPMPLTKDYIKTCELEVIGNIFDNPELVKEGSE